jgi:tetratricopeptide (TPR) repeat protein
MTAATTAARFFWEGEPMNVRAVAILAACAAVFLGACASTPRSASPLTIEMFDSRADAVPRTPPGAFRLPLPEPPAADHGAVMPGIEEGRDTAPVPAAPSPALALPTLMDAPVGAVDASLASPSRPALKAAFSLAAPKLPLAASAPAPTRKAPAAAPAARRSPPRDAAAAPASAIPVLPSAAPVAAGAPAPGGVSSSAGTSSGTGASSGASSAAAPSAGTAPGASPSNTYGRVREIYARQGDTLQVGLDGVGFLFLGLPDAQSDGMSFKSKENRDNRTLFTFQALKLGTYDLDFLQQDNMAGKTSRETVRVHVVSDQDFNAAVAAPASSPDAAPGDRGDPLFAQKLATLGSYQAAVAELLKGYREGNPGLNDQIASLYMRMGSYDAAEKYYARNLTPATDYTPRAVIGLVRVAVVQDDQQALLSYLKQFLAVSDPAAEEPLIQAVRMEKKRAEIGMALDLAGEYVTRYPSGTWRDEADYLTAQLLESDSQFRDIARARQLYRDIVAGHPESPYADTARQRVLYIDRHFYQVR